MMHKLDVTVKMITNSRYSLLHILRLNLVRLAVAGMTADTPLKVTQRCLYCVI